LEITIQKVESLDKKTLASIWFGDKQIMLNEDEFENLKENIELFNNRTAQEVPVREQSLINFSSQTGKKLHETCPKCWVKNKPYKCEFDKCPGYKLLAIETIEEK